MADATATMLIPAASALLGTVVGGAVTYWTQAALQAAAEKKLRKSIAAAIGGEIAAFLHVMERRQWEATFHAMLPPLRRGVDWKSGGPGTLGFSSDEKPLEPFPLFQSQLASLGVLGGDCPDVAKFYSLVRGVRGTLINAEHGAFDHFSPAQKADMIEAELAVWEEARALGESLVERLRNAATGQ